MTTRDSIYRAARSIKRRDNSLYNALCSIYQDSIFVNEISQLWPKLPLLANLRCGLWYSPRFDATCYFKSTDGHTNNLSFNTSRLNLHLPLLAGIYIYQFTLLFQFFEFNFRIDSKFSLCEKGASFSIKNISLCIVHCCVVTAT